MKRSKMIQILADNLYDTCIDRTEEQCKNTAEFILGIIESNGMLPPYNLKLQRMDDTLSSLEYFEWEPEELIVTNVDVENKTVTFKLK